MRDTRIPDKALAEMAESGTGTHCSCRCVEAREAAGGESSCSEPRAETVERAAEHCGSSAPHQSLWAVRSRLVEVVVGRRQYLPKEEAAAEAGEAFT